MKKIDQYWMRSLAGVMLGMSCLFLVACGGSKGETEQMPIFLGEPMSAEESTQDLNALEADGMAENDTLSKDGTQGVTNEKRSASDTQKVENQKIIQDDGEILETRILTPYGYERTEAEEGSLAEFLRQYPMKPAGAKVHLYDGSEKGNQSAHVAVFDLPIEDYDL